MMFNPFNTGGRGIASLIQPLLMGIGSQINQSTNTQLNDFGQKVEQLASESFPELEMNQPMGMQVARPIQAQNRDRFLSMFSPTPGVLTQDMNSAFSYPRNTPSAMRSAFGGISSLAQMFPRAT